MSRRRRRQPRRHRPPPELQGLEDLGDAVLGRVAQALAATAWALVAVAARGLRWLWSRGTGRGPKQHRERSAEP